ncbi:TRAP transporter large permease [Paracoccus sp. (in: a-proteobacteria)]|uniref:TRAP transporter large permease n=1 Tax=Paracoccus sp. TaxID=267 RepID=UPI002AFE5531|nr:TRAP transporter large permease [Paracoccus sp. (in: a-proteobacteria)]
MDPFMIGTLSICLMVALMLFGMPVAISMLTASIVGLVSTVGWNFTLTTLKTLPYAVGSNYVYAAIPMFVVMGVIAGSTGIVRDIYRAADLWLARVRGGLYMATSIASAGFGAINGSTIVGASLFTRIALPEMLKLGYDRGASAGIIAAAGTLAAMIPPSITMVLYGVLSNVSIGRILMAGILPGLLTVGAYIIATSLFVRIWPHWAPQVQEKPALSIRLKSLTAVIPISIIAFVIVGGIYSGNISASAAGAVGAVAVLILGTLMRRLKVKDVTSGLSESAQTTAMMFLIIMGGLAFSRMLLMTGFIDTLLSTIQESGVPAWALLLGLVLMYLVLGMLMDPISMMVVTIPIVHPLVVGLGYDPVWFAIVMVKLVELSCITPPVGLNLFVVVSAARGLVSSKDVFKGVLPFVMVELVVLTILIAFPSIILFMPNLMMGQ